jgi:hypothetical protein
VTAFFDNSWAFWWLLAIVAILRWFHLLSQKALSQSDPDITDSVGVTNAASLKLPHPSSL